MQSSSLLASWIIWLPLLGFVFNAFSGLVIKDRAAQKRAVAFVAPGVILGAFLITLIVLFTQVLAAPDHRVLAALIPGTNGPGDWISFGGFTIKFGLLLDPLSMLMALIVTGVGGLIHIYAVGYMADDREFPRFFTYFNLFIFMMLLLVMGENFLLMFVGWEGVGTCSYLLISFWYTDVNNAKAGNKAFIVNRVGDVGFALGIMAIWSVFGTLSFFNGGAGVMELANHRGGAVNVLQQHVPQATITMICLLLFVGAVGKSAQIPLFVWLPDAMAGPTPVSALIHAATMVTAGVVMLTRCSWLFVQSVTALQVVAWIGLATAVVGATIGLVQTDIKRVLAFSTVSQLGYMFMACGVGNFTAGMFHVTTHAFFKALLFLGSGAVIHSMHGEQDMRKMGGLRKLIPRTWLIMIIGTYAIAGVFPLSGLFSKDMILDAALRSPWGANGANMILYVVGLGTACMTAFYMNRLMWKTFYTEPRFVDGQLPAHHHSNFDDAEDAHGTHDTHDVGEAAHNPHGEQTGHEEATTGHDANADHGHDSHGTGRVHESPNSMMIPLYVLALLSIIAGMALGPTGAFARFLEPSVAPLSLGGLEEGHEVFSQVAGWAISTLVALAGIGLAAMRYRAHMQTGELATDAQKQRNPIYRFLVDKWEFDRFYNWLFINVGGRIATNFLWKGVDAGLIDGTVNGAANVVGGLSKVGRRVQTGLVRNYALIMLAGVVALLYALLSKLIQKG